MGPLYGCITLFGVIRSNTGAPLMPPRYEGNTCESIGQYWSALPDESNTRSQLCFVRRYILRSLSEASHLLVSHGSRVAFNCDKEYSVPAIYIYTYRVPPFVNAGLVPLRREWTRLVLCELKTLTHRVGEEMIKISYCATIMVGA